jgi:type I restriction enzyme M protein
MGDEDKKNLEQQLWNIANTLRGKMSADEFRNYILGFIFYKYLSEKMETYADEILKADGVSFQSIDETSSSGEELLEAVREEAIEKLGYFLNPSELFSVIAERGRSNTNNFILEDLTNILKNIERSTMGYESEDDFGNLFEDLDLTRSKLGKKESEKNELITKVLSHLDNINFDLKNSESDVLGDAYEYLIGQFAAGAGKKAGEFYTPQQVSKILAKIVTNSKSKLKSVYDPTCGSGSLLLRVSKEVNNVPNFYGQESNSTTYNLARMNMILHDVHYSKFNIKQDDTLRHPQHLEERFEAVVANPPFSAKWSANPLYMSDDRFSQYGKLAPKTKADFAFVQHMVHQLDENGTMAVIMPHGVLFRGAAEEHIRTFFLNDKNYLDAVIGLPANIFYGTGIPTCILVFKKCREDNDHVLFIDASNDFEKIKAQNYLNDEHVDKIIDTFKNRESIEKYSYLASLDEIKENDYNLNIPRYVDTFEEEEPVNLDEVSRELKALDAEMQITDSEIDKFCKELGISVPF